MRGTVPDLGSYPEVHCKTLLSSRLYQIPILGSHIRNYNKEMERQIYKEFIFSDADFFIYQRTPRSDASVIGYPSGSLIYDCMDNFTGFSGADPQTDEWEAELCDRADYIWVVSRQLQEKLSRWHSKVRYVPNGVNYEHFSRTRLLAETSIKPKQKQILIYVGTIHDWFDVQLVHEVATKLVDWDIVLVGPSSLPADQMRYLNNKNIIMMGSRDYSKLPELLSTANVAMIPFVLNELNKSTSPIKLFEYLAAGLPVVSTSMPEVLPFIEKGVVSCADSPSEFAAAVLDLAKSNNADRCQEIAKQCSWKNRFLPLLEEIGCSVSPK
jgi:glycosyltransferase involved in cell wall biosynthesis